MRTRVWSQVVVVLLAALLGAGCQGCELGDDDDDFDCGTCDHGATCVPAMRACACPTGYAGDGTAAGTGCADVDECTAGTDGCVDVHGTCTNTVGGHTCGCAPGYAGDGTAAGTGCTDVDECAAGTDDCLDHGRCANTDGGYTCGCAPGYAGDGTAGGTGCVDVDECAAGTDDCAAVGGACANTPGGFTCSCAPGFTGDGRTCTDVDECALGLDHCVGDDDGGLCTNTPGSYSCACDEDAVGDGVVTTAGGTGCTEVATNPRLVVPRRMVADKTLTVRADVLDASGKVDARGCYDTLGSVRMTRLADGADQPLTVTEFDDHLPVPADSLRFYHGVGSVSFTLDAGAATPPGRYRLTVTVGGRTATRIIRVLPSPTWRVMPATLTGADLVWGPHENIRLSAHTTEIPAGSTLVIHPGTLIMVDTTGGVEDGTLVNVNGQVDARGTLARPIHIFSARGPAAMTHTVSGSLSNANAWRGLFFFGAGSSSLRYLVLTGAGNGVVVSHPRPPILNLFGTHNLVVEDCVLVDSTGMMFQSPGTGSYQIRRTLVSRVGIGAEFLSAGHTLRIEDSWWTGIGRGPSTPVRYDGDGIHVDGAGSNQVIRGCIIADIGDDGIDHSNSTFTVENTIIHGVRDKAVSLTAGMITMRGSLVFDAGSGIRGTARVFTSTIAAPSPIATVDTLQESIVWPQSVSTCTGNVGWSIVGSAGDLGCGTGNRSVDPRFTDPGQCDFRPLPGSPAWTAGPTGGLVGFPGFPSWQP